MINKKTLLAILLMIISSLFGGCSNSPSPNIPVQQDQQQTTTPPVSEKEKETGSAAKLEAGKMMVTVYSATKDAMYLVAEQHVVPKNEHPAQTAIELLIAGTKNADLMTVMPASTQLRSISIKDKIAYVDFNDKLVKNSIGGSAMEILLVGAIVNTLTDFHEIQKVQILVEGKKIETISGHVDTSEPLNRFEKMIKK